MKNYVGIDLGTTNSAICSFDGEHVRLYQSPEQHEVTPSAIFINSRGSKYIGKRAYDQAARSHVRFAFCKRPEVLTEALTRLSRLSRT